MPQGTVGKRGASWYFAHRIDQPSTGLRRQKWQGGFATKAEAERALRASLTQLETGTWVEPSKLRYIDYVEQMWLPALTLQVESSTHESYSRNMRVHVLPAIGGVRMQKLTPNHLNDLYRKLLDQPEPIPGPKNRRHPAQLYAIIDQRRGEDWSYAAIAAELRSRVPGAETITKDAVARIVARSKERGTEDERTLGIRTVRYIHTIISKSLKDAAKLGLLNQNVAANASPPRAPKTRPERKLWTGEQTRLFLEWCRATDHQHADAFTFVATSGDRRGANLGLRWKDIDFDDGTAKLILSVTSVAHQIVVKPYGKTGNTHEIVLDPMTLSMLTTRRTLRPVDGDVHVCETIDPKCNQLGQHDRDLVFSRPDGNYLHPERFSKEFQRTQIRFNAEHPDEAIPVIGLHGLRHGWATLALEAGIPMKVVQDRLNHSSERITADIYTHVRRPLRSDAAEQVAKGIFPAQIRFGPDPSSS